MRVTIDANYALSWSDTRTILRRSLLLRDSPNSFQGLSGLPNELSAHRHDCASRGSRQRL